MELRECPFCGGEAIGFEWSDDEEIEEGEPHRYDAYCAVKVNHKDNCVLEVGEFYCWVAPSEEEAAVLWNRRAELTCRLTNSRWDDGHCTWGCVCSECGEKFEYEHGSCWNYCPHCGAKVVGE